jgi:murein DD-endopeptidase MepM/ murein hydrolase activator NlpD
LLYPVKRRGGSPFGWRRVDGRDDLHTGIDFAAPMGEPVRAAEAGTVRAVYEPGEWQRGGRVVVLEHPADPSPLFTLYAHLSAALVAPGDAVQAGQIVALVGDTAGTRDRPDARTKRPHLHFELLTRWPPSGIDQDRIDPAPYLRDDDGAPLPPPSWPARRAAGVGAVLAALIAVWAYSRNKGAGAFARPGARPSQRYLFRTDERSFTV